MIIQKFNETPVRTARNFNINNISVDYKVPNYIQKFNNIDIKCDDSKVKFESNIDDFELKYGINKTLENQIKTNSNQKIKITIDSKTNKEIGIEYVFDEKNQNLVEDIQIVSNNYTKETVIIKYKTTDNQEYYHNGRINVIAKENSFVNIIIVNMLNTRSNNFLSIENNIEKNAKVKYTIIDFGGKNSITNYYSNLVGDNSDNALNTIYLGKENQLFDLNYIGELRGQKSNIDIEVQGALKDTAKKHFKGTIDFKKGCKKATGNENEACMLLSDTAKSIALPMLLCSEEDVEGNHSSSAGKIGEKELFYIMSRGFELKEAMKLVVRAKFNKILADIKNEDLKQDILEEIDRRLD